MKLGIHMLFNEHTKTIMVSIVVNNVALVKQQYTPSGNTLAISETRRCRAATLGEVIETYNCDGTNM